MEIINLTQHTATPAQKLGGVVELNDEVKPQIVKLLTFTELPSQAEIEARAAKIADIANGACSEGAMIGGAPYLMTSLERALKKVGVKPMYAFSERVSVETVDELTGIVTKTNVFEHIGFVEV